MAGSKLIFAFAGRVVADAVDRVLADALVNRSKGTSVYEFDFRETTFIHISCCQLLIAYWVGFQKKGKTIVIRTPARQAVRDFWRVWNFPEAARQALSVEFDKLLHPDDRIHLNEIQKTYDERRLLKSFSAATSVRRQKNFLAFHTTLARFGQSIDKYTPLEKTQSETELWKRDEISNALSEFLGRDHRYFPSRVIFEAVFNAFKHPDADKIQISGYHPKLAHRLDATAIDLSESTLSFVFWDNGHSILKTLSQSINDELAVRTSYADLHAMRYLVEYRETPTNLPALLGKAAQISLETLGSNLRLDSQTPEHYRLLASFFPGVTSKPYAVFHAVDPELLADQPELGARGMGLYTLANAVVNVLKGEIFLRTDKYFLSMRAITPNEARKNATDASVIVRITKCHSVLPTFCGNMLFINFRSSTQNDPIVTEAI